MKIKGNISFIYILFGVILTYFSSYLPDLMGVIGIEGTRISSIVAFGSLNGMLYGPFWGAIISGTGMLLHEINNTGYLSKNIFSMLSPFFIMLSSVISGLIVNRQHKAALGIFGSLIVVWYLFDVGRSAFFYPWFHIVVFVAFIIFQKNSIKSIHSRTFVFVSLFFAALIGVLSDHLMGSIAYSYIFDLSTEAFRSAVLLYPLERTILALSATFVAFFFFSTIKDIILSSEGIEDDVSRMRSRNMDDYLYNDVIPIIEKKDNDR
ncbi:hypothetical protein CUN85_02155 [Methanolobus halotolerans]|uniref:Energy-coupling factor transport system substrate-specific component n=1 Tax=Methanolobus halotolerans TaxID=2052935 RepID=A0A4E0PXN8_9EURY|nr:hypothetical protein CUN85_02155 [Methanolobus halotolerans]